MQNKIPCVYILANKRNGTLYTGVTSNLPKRIYEHKNNIIKGFTQKYNVHTLVYFEQAEEMMSAIEREKQIKGGLRKKKLALIEKDNQEWKDLYNDL
jgi:putative endonuclease